MPTRLTRREFLKLAAVTAGAATVPKWATTAAKAMEQAGAGTVPAAPVPAPVPASAAAAVAGLRPRPEPAEVVTESALGSEDWGIYPHLPPREPIKKWMEAKATYRVPSCLLDDSLCDIEAYIEAEIRAQMREIALEIDREWMYGTSPLTPMGVIR